MKKNIFITLIFIGTCMACFAQNEEIKKAHNIDSLMNSIPVLKQKRFLINVHGGTTYGLASTYNFFPDGIRYVTVIKSGSGAPQKTTIYQTPWKGLGDGYRIGSGISYILSDFINIGLDWDYFKTSLKKTRDSSYQETLATNAPGAPNQYIYNERKTINYKESVVTLTPNITFKAYAKPKWFLYAKIGAILTFRPNSTEEDTREIKVSKGRQGALTDSSSTEIRKYDWSIKTPAFGFISALGIQVKVAGRLRAFGELQFSHMVFIAQKKTISNFTVNNKDMVASLPLSLREVDFVTNITNETNAPNPNKASQALVQRIPITYLGAQFGLAFQL